MKLEIPEGYEIDLENSDIEGGIINVKRKNNKWEELESISGYYIDNSSSIWGSGPLDTINENKNTFKTEYQARASLALSQLSQVLSYVNKDWKPNWCVSSEKWCINLKNILDGVFVSGCYIHPNFLSFEDRETAEKFLEDNEYLIKQAAPFLWGVEL